MIKEEGVELSVVGDELWNRCLPTHAYKQTSIFFSDMKILLYNASTASQNKAMLSLLPFHQRQFHFIPFSFISSHA